MQCIKTQVFFFLGGGAGNLSPFFNMTLRYWTATYKKVDFLNIFSESSSFHLFKNKNQPLKLKNK